MWTNLLKFLTRFAYFCSYFLIFILQLAFHSRERATTEIMAFVVNFPPFRSLFAYFCCCSCCSFQLFRKWNENFLLLCFPLLSSSWKLSIFEFKQHLRLFQFIVHWCQTKVAQASNNSNMLNSIMSNFYFFSFDQFDFNWEEKLLIE